MFRKFKIWIFAHLTSKRLWRVTYDGEENSSMPVSYKEAKYMVDTWGGIYWIDYKTKL